MSLCQAVSTLRNSVVCCAPVNLNWWSECKHHGFKFHCVLHTLIKIHQTTTILCVWDHHSRNAISRQETFKTLLKSSSRSNLRGRGDGGGGAICSRSFIPEAIIICWLGIWRGFNQQSLFLAFNYTGEGCKSINWLFFWHAILLFNTVLAVREYCSLVQTAQNVSISKV